MSAVGRQNLMWGRSERQGMTSSGGGSGGEGGGEERCGQQLERSYQACLYCSSSQGL